MDLLEHVDPAPVVTEVARVLRPRGSFYFHTFNRTWLARLVVVHAVELFVRNVPPHLHDHRAFVRPDELRTICEASGLEVRELRGCRPELSTSLVRLGLSGVVPPELAFRYTSSLAIGYAGRAERVPR
jgi:2-polyprenyl-6-hydroxyphenyl methylase/3-demethylubiquinone-9 3-methyltransferase